MIARAMDKVGNEGVITVEEAKSLETELDVVEGMQFDRGYISPYFVTNAEKMICEFLENPYVPHPREEAVEPAGAAAAARAGRPVGPAAALVAEDIEGEVLATLVVNKLRGGLKVAAVKRAGLRRSPQGDARGHRRPDRWPRDQR